MEKTKRAKSAKPKSRPVGKFAAIDFETADYGIGRACLRENRA
jgi:hypothetical protein